MLQMLIPLLMAGAGAGIGATTNKKNRGKGALKGALLGGGLGLGAGALGLGGGAAAGGAGSGILAQGANVGMAAGSNAAAGSAAGAASPGLAKMMGSSLKKSLIDGAANQIAGSILGGGGNNTQAQTGDVSFPSMNYSDASAPASMLSNPLAMQNPQMSPQEIELRKRMLAGGGY